MIRILFFFLLALMFSCSNTRPTPASELEEQPATEQASSGAADLTQDTTSAARETAQKPDEASLAADKQQAQVDQKVAARQKQEAAKAVQHKAHTQTLSDKKVEHITDAQVPADDAQVQAQLPADDTQGQAQLPADDTQGQAQLPATTDASSSTTPVAESETSATKSETLFLVTTPVPTPAFVESERHKQRFLPTRRRIDREIDKLKFAYKGEVIVGLTASYGTLSSDDTDFMLLLDNINAKGTIATVRPFLGYFYRDNNCVGLRFGYQHVGGSLNGANLDLGESNDISMAIPYVDLKSNNYMFGIFHRSYAGLDPKGRFGLFAEFELALATGSSEFAYESGNTIKRTYSDNTKVSLSFNPGAAVYIFPNVCATLSFGLGGIQYNSVTQKDAEGNKIGSRKASNMKFKLNIAAINIGMTIHLWDKKKK